MKIILLTIGVLLLSSFSIYSIDFFDDMPPEELAESLINEMSDEEILGQTLMFSYEGSFTAETTLNWINNSNLGGVKIFGWNTHNLAGMIDAIGNYQQAALNNRFRIPLLIATDQEGGIVRHLSQRSSWTPGNMAIGATGMAQESYDSGYHIAMEMRAMGINMNFAPNVDLYLNSETNVVSVRGYGDDPATAGYMGIAFMRGSEEAGVIPTAKHFPGHGQASGDSHGLFPIIDISLEELESIDLVPYKMLIAEGVPAIMVGHLGFSQITEELRPATTSKFLVDELLKNRLGFEGLVITDDMYMKGAQFDGSSLPVLCEEALRSGIDMVLLSRGEASMQAVWARLIAAMKSDPEFNLRVRDAAYRVLKIKAEYLKGDLAVPYIPDYDNVLATLPTEGMEDHILNLAGRSVTLLRDERIPLTSENSGRTLVVSGYNVFNEEVLRVYPGAEVFEVDYSILLTPQRNRLRAIIDTYDTVILPCNDYKDSFFIQGLEDWKEKVVVIMMDPPDTLALEFNWAQTVIDCYMLLSETVKISLEVLQGNIEAEGKSPIEIPHQIPEE